MLQAKIRIDSEHANGKRKLIYVIIFNSSDGQSSIVHNIPKRGVRLTSTHRNITVDLSQGNPAIADKLSSEVVLNVCSVFRRTAQKLETRGRF